MTEERSIGYDEGYQAGWNAAMDAKPEQPAQQEPVYVQTRQKGFSDWGSLLDPKHRNSKWAKGVEMRLLYTSPQPAQRTWVGLTDEDVRQCSRDVVAGGKENSVDRFAYAIEAKLKEKNT